MWTKIKYSCCCLALVILGGCNLSPPLTQEEETQAFVNDNLPNGAVNVIDMGNGWLTFDSEIKGELKTFLYRKEGDERGECSWGYEAITQVQ